MTSTLEDLETRLTLVENDLRSARDEIRALRSSGMRERRIRRSLVSFAAAAGSFFVAAGPSGSSYADPSSQVLTVRAPFTVVDDAGRQIFLVRQSENGEENTARVYNKFGGLSVAAVGDGYGRGKVIVYDGQPGSDPGDSGAAAIGVDVDGNGAFMLQDRDAKAIADIRKTEDGSGLQIYGDNKPRIELTTYDWGASEVSINPAKGKLITGFSVDESGQGIIHASDGTAAAPYFSVTLNRLELSSVNEGTAGQVVIGMNKAGGMVVVRNAEFANRAALSADFGVEAWNTKGQMVGRLSSDTSERGRLTLWGLSSDMMVEAGSLESDKGYVLVNPWISASNNPSVLMGGTE